MKKTILSLVALMCVTFGASAMSLKEAYGALSNIPNVSVTKPDYNLPVDLPIMQDSGFGLESGNLAAAYNLNADQIKTTADAAFTILNQVPLVYVLNGGGNSQVTGLVYSESTGQNSNDVLIVAMSGYRGSAVFMYVPDVPDSVCAAIAGAPVEMEGNSFSLKSKLPGDEELNIILNKGR